MKAREILSEIITKIDAYITEEANRKWTKQDTICSIVSAVVSIFASVITALLCTK